jgi:hypothetical protein
MMYASKNGTVVERGDILHGIYSETWVFLSIVDKYTVVVGIYGAEGAEYYMPTSVLGITVQSVGAMA